MMNAKIKNYVETLFSDIPRSKKAIELKEEMLSNMNERYEDYVREGKTENQAYSLVIANLGDVDEILRDVIPDEDFKANAARYRIRNAKNTAIGVGLYIFGAILLIGLSFLGDSVPHYDDETFAILGLISMLLCAAVATGLIVYTNMSTPPEFKHRDKDEYDSASAYISDDGDKKLHKHISSIVWLLAICTYFLVSFTTHAWHITWIIYVVAALVDRIVAIMLEMRKRNA